MAPDHAHDCGRRTVLAGGLAAMGSLVLGGSALAAGVPGMRRVDIHHHFLPPLFKRHAGERGALNPAIAELSIARSIEAMDAAGVRSAILSIPSPGADVAGPDAARAVSRDANEHAARTALDHPGRFGSFATLPLPDIDAAAAEAVHALDMLGAQGVQLWTSYGKSWLGDTSFWPFYAELERRRATVFVHPTTPACCGNLQPGLPITVIEYGTDTTRAIASLLFSGTLARFPNIKWVFSHSGGTMPFLIERFLLQEKTVLATPAGRDKLPNGVLAEIRKLHYETAQSANPYALGTLVRLVPGSQIHFGTDFPYRQVAEQRANLDGCSFLSNTQLRAIAGGNSDRLFPTLLRRS